MNAVQSGSPRTPLADDETDLYPVALARDALRPGTVFADPYGHTLTIVRWVAQTDDAPGRLLAVDAEPDGTIGIKRFWRGNFLFETDRVIGEPGFKAFRPVVRERGMLRTLTNDMIPVSAEFAPFSLEQRGLAKNAFYDRMEALINPDRLDPRRRISTSIGPSTSFSWSAFCRWATDSSRRARTRARSSRCPPAGEFSRLPDRGRISRRRTAT